MRVMVVADHLGYGGGIVHGLTTYFTTHLPALRDAGVDLATYFLRSRHPAASKLEERGIKPIFLGRAKWDPRAVVDVWRQVRIVQPDVLHLHGEKSRVVAGFAALRFDTPVIFHMHDNQPPTFRALHRWLGSRTARFELVSEALVPYAEQVHRAPPKKIEVVHHGIDVSAFVTPPAGARAGVRKELGIGPDTPVVGMIGRIDGSKGQRQFIEAMARVLPRCPHVRGLIVGDGPDRDHCMALARKLQVVDALVFCGQRADIPSILAAVDLTTTPSMCEEAFCFAALEAEAAGRPVIAFRRGALSLLVQHDETGFLVEAGDVNGLAEAIVRLVEDDELRLRLGKGAAARARSFSMSRHTERQLTIYEEVAARSRAKYRRE